MKNFKGSLKVPKNLEKGTLWDFLTFVLSQDIKQTEGWTLCRHEESLKNFRKTKMRILNSHIVAKILKRGTFGDF